MVVVRNMTMEKNSVVVRNMTMEKNLVVVRKTVTNIKNKRHSGSFGPKKAIQKAGLQKRDFTKRCTSRGERPKETKNGENDQ